MPAAAKQSDHCGRSCRFAPPTITAEHSFPSNDRFATDKQVRDEEQAVFNATEGPLKSKV